MNQKLLKLIFYFFILLFLNQAVAEDNFFEISMNLKAAEKFDEAIFELDLLLIHDPLNIQALEQKALILSWTQKFAASIVIWKKIIDLQSQNLKYRINLARVLYWSGDFKHSLDNLDQVLNIDPNNNEAQELRRTVSKAKPRIEARFRIDVGGILDNFSAVREDESSSFLQLGMKLNSKIDTFLRFDNQNHFKATDQTLGAGLYYKLASDWLLNADYTAIIKAPNFLPRAILNAGFENFSFNPVSFSFGYRALSFEQGSVFIYQPGIQWSEYSLAAEYRYGLSQNIDKTMTSSSQIKVSYSFIESTSVSLGYTTGEEALPPLAKAKVNYSTLGLQHQFDDQHSVRLDYTLEDRINVYKHQSIGFSYAYKF